MKVLNLIFAIVGLVSSVAKTEEYSSALAALFAPAWEDVYGDVCDFNGNIPKAGCIFVVTNPKGEKDILPEDFFKFRAVHGWVQFEGPLGFNENYIGYAYCSSANCYDPYGFCFPDNYLAWTRRQSQPIGKFDGERALTAENAGRAFAKRNGLPEATGILIAKKLQYFAVSEDKDFNKLVKDLYGTDSLSLENLKNEKMKNWADSVAAYWNTNSNLVEPVLKKWMEKGQKNVEKFLALKPEILKEIDEIEKRNSTSK